MRKFYTVSYIILTILTAAALVTAILKLTGAPSQVLTTAALIVFAAVQLICALRYKGTGRSVIYRVGFAAMHIGMLAFLGGSLIFSVGGESLYAEMPVNGLGYSRIMRSDGTEKNLGFSISADEFSVEVYEDTGLDKSYTASLTLTDEITLAEMKAELRVNAPLRYSGMKIYLMSYASDDSGDSIQLLFKRDDGEILSTAGCVCVIAGAFMLCFGSKNASPSKKSKEAAA